MSHPPPELGRDVFLDDRLLVELVKSLLLLFHLLVFLEMLNVLGMGKVLKLGVFIMVSVGMSISPALGRIRRTGRQTSPNGESHIRTRRRRDALAPCRGRVKSVS